MKLFAIVFGLEQEGNDGERKCGKASKKAQFAGGYLTVYIFDSVHACWNAKV